MLGHRRFGSSKKALGCPGQRNAWLAAARRMTHPKPMTKPEDEEQVLENHTGRPSTSAMRNQRDATFNVKHEQSH